MTPSNKQTARAAGLAYLVVILTGVFSLLYVPSQLITMDDPAATVGNITASETLFRLGLASGLICYSFFVVLPVVLYKLLEAAGRMSAALMVLFAVASVPIAFIAIMQKVAILSLIGQEGAAGGLTADQVQTQVMRLLELYNSGIFVASVFWGLWLLPFGYLVFRSGILPRIFGVLLMLGCGGYLMTAFGSLLFPGYVDTILPTIAGIPSGLGEIGICLWLLIMGAQERPTARTA